ncbi:MAG: hypothetical protein ABSD58_05460 [Verrucomicrobiia bacterium]|jgi:hypothetical protein
MNNERKDFLLVCGTPSALMDAQETAWYLGFTAHDIPILVRVGLLKPLGHPPATATLTELRTDPQWLARASDAIVRHWQTKNARKTKVHNGRIEPPDHNLPQSALTRANSPAAR